MFDSCGAEPSGKNSYEHQRPQLLVLQSNLVLHLCVEEKKTPFQHLKMERITCEIYVHVTSSSFLKITSNESVSSDFIELYFSHFTKLVVGEFCINSEGEMLKINLFQFHQSGLGTTKL